MGRNEFWDKFQSEWQIHSAMPCAILLPSSLNRWYKMVQRDFC